MSTLQAKRRGRQALVALCGLLLVALAWGAARFWAAQQRPAVAYPTPTEIAGMQRGVAFSSHHQPDAQDTLALIEAELDRRRLMAEALQRGLHHQDAFVRERLLQDADFLGITGTEREQLDALVSQGLVQQDAALRERLITLLLSQARANQAPPTEAQLREHFAATPQRWVTPARWQLRVLAFTGADAPARAAQALQQLRSGVTEAQLQADNAPDERTLPLKIAPRLAAIFGEDFVAALPTALSPEWQGPITTRQGVQLVQVQRYEPPLPMDFATARNLVAQAWRDQQRASVDAAFTAELRTRYRVRAAANTAAGD